MKTIEQLQEENAALSAQVGALREAYYSYIETGFDEILDNAFAATPQHHLRELKAEAGRAGYLACATEYGLENAHASKEGIARNANQYAEQVRRGGVE